MTFHFQDFARCLEGLADTYFMVGSQIQPAKHNKAKFFLLVGSDSIIKICFVGYKRFHLLFILNCLLSFTLFHHSSFAILKLF